MYRSRYQINLKNQLFNLDELKPISIEKLDQVKNELDKYERIPILK